MYFLRNSQNELLTMDHDKEAILVRLNERIDQDLKKFNDTADYCNLQTVWSGDNMVQLRGRYIHSPIYSDKILEFYTINDHISGC